MFRVEAKPEVSIKQGAGPASADYKALYPEDLTLQDQSFKDLN
jgi:hypothetical protein